MYWVNSIRDENDQPLEFETIDDALSAFRARYPFADPPSSISWTEYDSDGHPIAEGGECLDPDCHCHKVWTNWSER